MTAPSTGKTRIGGASPLRGLYRHFRPIPRSPVPRSADEVHALQLVPRSALTERFEWALDYLRKAHGADIGDYLEFGVYNGSSMRCMHDALKVCGVEGVKLVGFDSFQGLPEDVVHEDGGVWRAGQFACPRHVTQANLEKHGVPMETVQLVEGWYRDTLAIPPSAYGLQAASIVMIDSDAYSSAKLSLAFIEPILTSPSVILFDDWKLNDLDLMGMGEYRAFKEFLWAHCDLRAVEVKSYSRKSKIFVLTRTRRAQREKKA